MGIDEFEKQKMKQLARTDHSNIGEWDKKIAGLCKKINKKKDYYTTSSCSGRVVLLKYSEKKEPDIFLFRTHERITLKELKKALSEVKFPGIVKFQQTSCILHVACRTVIDAQKLVTLAKLSGWKRSGIMATGKRNVVELHSTESMDMPIMNKGKVLVGDGFLKIIVREANNKLERVWEKIKRLERMI